MKACTLFTSDNEVAEDWLVKFKSREPLDIYGQKYLIDEISTDYEHGFSGVTIKMYPVYQAKSPKTPKKQEAWNGDGLPPVGMDIECTFDSWGYWRKGRVLYYGKQMIFMEQYGESPDGRKFEGSMNPGGIKFRPIRTAEQVAAEERDKAVFEIAHILIDNRHDSAEYHQAGRIYDAGYRKQ